MYKGDFERMMDIRREKLLQSLAALNCSNCKYRDKGVCNNCYGVEGTTEVSTSGKCENWVIR